jgi:hypothetical protein
MKQRKDSQCAFPSFSTLRHSGGDLHDPDNYESRDMVSSPLPFGKKNTEIAQWRIICISKAVIPACRQAGFRFTVLDK